MIETTLAAVFVTGLFGGLHCAGMCGGIVAALSHRPAVVNIQRMDKFSFVDAGKCLSTTGCAAPTQRLLTTQLLYNVGRLTTYALLGLLAGSVGSISWWMGFALPLQQFAFAITNIVLVMMGLYIAGFTQAGLAFEWIGHSVWKKIHPYALAQIKSPRPGSALTAGVLWGLVPCGMVYGVLIAALVSASAAQGAALMLAFGLGTLPALLTLGAATHWVKKSARKIVFKRVAGTVIVLYGIAGFARLDAASQIPFVGPMCSYIARIPAAGM